MRIKIIRNNSLDSNFSSKQKYFHFITKFNADFFVKCYPIALFIVKINFVFKLYSINSKRDKNI